jgi:hypothetical protein
MFEDDGHRDMEPHKRPGYAEMLMELADIERKRIREEGLMQEDKCQK